MNSGDNQKERPLFMLKSRVFGALPGRRLKKRGDEKMTLLKIRQIFYAYRKKDFRLNRQFYPNLNYCRLWVSGQLTREMILTFTSAEKKTPLINDLFRIKGIKRVIPNSYEVKVEKESVFDWQEILPEAEKIIIKHLIKK